MQHNAAQGGSMNIVKNLEGDRLVIALEGRLDTSTAPELEAVIKEELAGIDSAVLDFEKLEYISSAGLRVLLSTHKALMSKGGLMIKNVRPEIMEVLEITGFSDILNIG